jgi:ABC-type Fe3+-hydroxamate transport system substrate-binding protein
MRRTFVDATGTSVPLLRTVRRVVAADGAVASLLIELGATVVGCAGTVEGIASVGTPRTPDSAAVAALRPDAIVVGAVDGVPDIADARLLAALRRIAPVIAVDLAHPEAATRDLRALLGSGADLRQAPPPPGAELPPWLRRVPAPTGPTRATPPGR